jgi:hypothetical protein
MEKYPPRSTKEFPGKFSTFAPTIKQQSEEGSQS